MLSKMLLGQGMGGEGGGGPRQTPNFQVVHDRDQDI